MIMIEVPRIRIRPLLPMLMVAAVTLTACDDFLAVENPNLVDASEIDPLVEAEVLALSVQQEFTMAYSRIAPYAGWFTGTLLNADINPAGNLISNRNLEPTSGAVNSVFNWMSRTRVLGGLVTETVAGTNLAVSVPAARAALWTGYAFLYLGEFFCQATVDGGPPLSTQMMMDSTVHHLTRASTIAGQVGAAAADFRDAAQVGIARAHLHLGRAADARAAAESVRSGFEFRLHYSEDLANRGRVGNQIWTWSFGSGAQISAAPAYRNLDDPRVDIIPPAENNSVPFDGETEMWILGKYQGYSAPIRFASRLEADYLIAEAGGTQAMLAFVQERRAANGQPAYDGATDPQSVLEEFLEQRTRDFFVEGKRMGDYRRHPNGLRTMLPAGTPYHKPGLPPYAELPCWPIPQNEVDRNPHLRP